MYRTDLPDSTLSLVLPPYQVFTGIHEIAVCPERGVALLWTVLDATTQQAEYEWLLRRPPSIALVIMLPPPGRIEAALPLLREAGALRPRGVLPNSGVSGPEALRLLLGSAPRDLPGMAVGHFTNEGILRNQKVRALVHRMFDMAPVIPSITRLSRKMYTTRRTLGRLFESEGLPVPSHWLQLARLVCVSALIQERQELPIFKAATQVGYPDGFTMSNQMKRLIGCRPSDVRENLGLTWILEEWIKRERVAGRMSWPGMKVRNEDVNEWLRGWPRVTGASEVHPRFPQS